MSDNRVQWLTTHEVMKQYGFNPLPYIERQEAGDLYLRNKLRSVFVRVWMKDDVESNARQILAKLKEGPVTIRANVDTWVKRMLGK